MRTILILLTYMFVVPLSAQNEADFFNAIKNADLVTFESYLEDNIDLCLFEDQQIMNKKSAVAKFKTFLDMHKVTNIEIMHKGVSKDKSTQYKVAKLSTAKDTYRLFVYATGGSIQSKTVKEIRIDKF